MLFDRYNNQLTDQISGLSTNIEELEAQLREIRQQRQNLENEQQALEPVISRGEHVLEGLADYLKALNLNFPHLAEEFIGRVEDATQAASASLLEAQPEPNPETVEADGTVHVQADVMPEDDGKIEGQDDLKSGDDQETDNTLTEVGFVDPAMAGMQEPVIDAALSLEELKRERLKRSQLNTLAKAKGISKPGQIPNATMLSEELIAKGLSRKDLQEVLN